MEKQILTEASGVLPQDVSYRSFLVVIRYPALLSFLGILSMAIFHFPLFLNKKIGFYKLMGTGKNGSFDIWPDFQQWSVMLFYNKALYADESGKSIAKKLLGNFINGWLKLSKAKVRFIHLEPYVGHGSWDNQTFISQRKSTDEPIGKIAVLTRATIRLSRLISFWKAVPSASFQLDQHPGFLFSIGIGEIPLIKQATFSIWDSEANMKAYAYKMRAHQEVIRRTRDENWYSEEMFLRFRLLDDFC
ncbi:MAG: spheroidene monooxygenase [Chitinophagaceae bacterium]